MEQIERLGNFHGRYRIFDLEYNMPLVRISDMEPITWLEFKK